MGRCNKKCNVFYFVVYNTSINNIENTTFDEKVSNILDKQRVVGSSKYATQVINKDKYIIIDQYGIKKHEKIEAEDVDKALMGGKDLYPITHKIESTNEHVMSVSVPIKINNVIEGAIRYTVSLTEIDATIFKLALGLILAGIFILIIAISLSLRFAETIIQPLIELKEFANELAHGNFSIKLKDTSISDDEIGDLAKTFVHMAAEIDKSEKLKEEFISSISHELRTPLTSIQTHLEAMIDGIWEPDTERLNSVNEEVIRLTNLVNQLQNLAKFDSEKSKLNLAKVNVKNLIMNVVYNNQGKALEKNINIECDLESIDSYLDKDKISQVIVNLLSNAIRYTNNGGKIFISSYKENNNLKIQFKDNGIGIPKENIKYIFERFYRVDESRSKNTGGIGVGLTIVKSIIDLHQGTIEVRSELNKGSEFIVILPNL